MRCVLTLGPWGIALQGPAWTEAGRAARAFVRQGGATKKVFCENNQKLRQLHSSPDGAENLQRKMAEKKMSVCATASSGLVQQGCASCAASDHDTAALQAVRERAGVDALGVA